MLVRSLILATLMAGISLASGRDTGWQTGTFHLEGDVADGWKGGGVSAARSAPGRPSDNPLSDSLIFDIYTPNGSYRASIDALLIDQSVTAEELFPWLKDVPQRVQFRVKGNTLYLLDSKNKQHKADLIPVPVPMRSKQH
jgi:hypothetical protein